MTVTIRNEAELVVPRSVRRLAGMKSGDRVEFRVSGGVISIIPEQPPTDEEYTPAQRRSIDRQLANAAKSRIHGPFESADEAIACLKQSLKKRAAGKTTTRRVR